MNEELLRKIQVAILKEPAKFRMDVWSCNTAHCIGGTACLLAGHRLDLGDADEEDFESVASRSLRLNHAQAGRLFYLSGWPEAILERYADAEFTSDRPAMATIAVERIDHFIATQGAE